MRKIITLTFLFTRYHKPHSPDECNSPARESMYENEYSENGLLIHIIQYQR